MNKRPSAAARGQHFDPDIADGFPAGFPACAANLWRTLARLAAAGLCLVCLTAADSTSVGLAPAAPGATSTASSAFLASLTEQERAWLRAHPVIRVAQDPNWPPIEFEDQRGNPTGMTKDYLTLIEQRLGRKFELVLHVSWQEALARMKRGEIDMTTTVAETPTRLEFLAFTKPYMNIPIVIATQQDVTYIGNLRELAGKKVAAVDGYAVHEWMQKDFPEVRLLKVKTSLEGLQRLQRGEVDAFIDSLVTIGHHQANRDVLNLKIAGATPYSNAQRMAVRKDWAPLAGILQKALDSISQAERDEIFRRWLPIRYEQGFDYTLLWQALAAFSAIFLGLGLWNRKLMREIRERKLAQVALKDNEENLAITLHSIGDAVIATDVRGLVTRINPVAERLTGWLQADALGRPLTEVFHIVSAETGLPSVNLVPQVMEHGKVIGLANHAVLLARDGHEYQIADSAAPIRNAAGEIVGVVLVFSDVTEKYKTEKTLHRQQLMMERTESAAKLASFEWEVDANVVTWSPEMFRIFGRDPALGIPNLEAQAAMYTPESAQKLFDAVGKAVADGTPYELELMTVQPDGKQRPCLTKGFPERDASGRVVRLAGLVQDITERKLTAEALLHTQALLANAEKMGRVGGWEIDVQTRQTTWTEGVYDIYELDGSDRLTVDQGINYYTPASRPIIEQAVQRAIDQDVPFDLELEIITAKGNRRGVHAVGKSDRARGRVSGFIQDITEHKAEQARRLESETLRSREQASALEAQRRSELAALNLLEDAVAARKSVV